MTRRTRLNSKGFTVLSNILCERIGLIDAAVFLRLKYIEEAAVEAGRIKYGDWVIFPWQQFQKMGVSRRYCENAINNLTKHGLIEFCKMGKGNRRHFRLPEDVDNILDLLLENKQNLFSGSTKKEKANNGQSKEETKQANPAAEQRKKANAAKHVLAAKMFQVWRNAHISYKPSMRIHDSIRKLDDKNRVAFPAIAEKIRMQLGKGEHTDETICSYFAQMLAGLDSFQIDKYMQPCMLRSKFEDIVRGLHATNTGGKVNEKGNRAVSLNDIYNVPQSEEERYRKMRENG